MLRDPWERAIPDVGLAAFQDAETGEVLLFDTSSRLAREKLAEKVEGTWAEQRKLFRQLRIDFVELFTDQEYLLPLILFFKHRAARMSR